MSSEEIKFLRDFLLNKILAIKAESHRMKCNKNCQKLILEIEEFINEHISEKKVK